MMKPRGGANGVPGSSPSNKLRHCAIEFANEVHCKRRLALMYRLANSEVLFLESTV